MRLELLDWTIVGIFLAMVLGIAIYVRRYTKSVADFLAGNRCAGRYLLTMSEGLAGMGVVGTVANFEKFYQSGFAASWWGSMFAPLGLVLALSGWVIYRYRETRALTLSQFFEMRYSRKIRIFSGLLAWTSGILNYGIYPGIVARFIMYFCGLPETVTMGAISFPVFPMLMAFMLGMAVLLATCGGMVTVIVTDFFQSQFVFVIYLIVLFVLLYKFQWSTIFNTLSESPSGHSMINPFDQADVGDFSVWFFMIFAFKAVYNAMGWQGMQGFNCSAKSPHEARMAGILASWRGGVSYLIMLLLPVCAYVLLHGNSYPSEALSVKNEIGQIADANIRSQVTVPIALAHMLPAGILGLFAAAMIGASIGSDTTSLHSWGSIFIQDVVLPFRKKPLSLESHLLILRLSILGVALFAFLFSLFFSIKDYIFMYMLVTGAIYLAGSGAVIIGGLYWSRGTTQGAWCSLLTGASLALTGGILRGVWPHISTLTQLSPIFPINGAWMAFIASLSSVTIYIIVSLITCREPFNLNAMLHRTEESPIRRNLKKESWKQRLGISAEFTTGDRRLFYFQTGWTLFWFAAFVVGTAVGLIWSIGNKTWVYWWQFNVGLSIVVAVITVIWFTWGGVGNLRELFAKLKAESLNLSDDGTVSSEKATAVEDERLPVK